MEPRPYGLIKSPGRAFQVNFYASYLHEFAVRQPAPKRGFHFALKTALSSRHRLPYDKVQFYFALADAHRNATFTLRSKRLCPPDICKDKFSADGDGTPPLRIDKIPRSGISSEFLRKLSSRIRRAPARTESRLLLCARNGFVLPTSTKIKFCGRGWNPAPTD